MSRPVSTIRMSVIIAVLGAGLILAPYAQATAAEKDMVLIPRGEFKMGSHHHDDETHHSVVVDSYLIDKYEASNKEYREFMKASNHPAPAYWDDPRLNKSNQPVVGVNWFDAKAFCEYKGKRLPTEAEWERAAKGPKENDYPWGNKFDAAKANYGQKIGMTVGVDSLSEGASGFGLYHMAGNVFEWVSDWYDPDYFKNSPTLNPQGPEKGYNFANQGPVRALKGGSWLAPETSLHTSHRFWNQPENNSYGVGLGFRCAKSVAGESLQASRDAYIQALIHMGAEKNKEALTSMEEAIKGDPKNKEYQQIRDLIKKSMK